MSDTTRNARPKDPLAYVAVEPERPDAAWAMAGDDDPCNLDAVVRWRKKGARILRVPLSQAKAMFARWTVKTVGDER